MMSTNSLFELIGRDGELQLHVPSAKSPIHYRADSQNANFAIGDGKWDFKSKSNDAGKHGRAVNFEVFLRTGH